jgi:hypothetical protein
MRKEVIADARIAAEPETVWHLLLDFPAYADWNPLIAEARLPGEARTGQRLNLRYRPPGLRERPARPELLRVLPARELSWLQRWFPVAGLLDMEHRFILEVDDEAGTRLLQRLRLSGLLVPLLWWKLRGPLQQGVMDLNKALACLALSDSPDAPAE